MKFVMTLISSLMAIFLIATSDFSPILEVQHLFANKRRILAAVGLGVCGFFLSFAALILSLVEGAMQYEVQGFVLWSALFTVALGLFLVSVLCFVTSRMILPRFERQKAAFQQSNLINIFEKWMHNLASMKNEVAARSNAEPRARTPSDDLDKFSRGGRGDFEARPGEGTSYSH